MPNPLYSNLHTQAFAITASDSKPVQGPKDESGAAMTHCRGIFALTSGNITARFKDDRANSAVTFPVVAGTYYPFSLTYVYSTSTATLLGLV